METMKGKKKCMNKGGMVEKQGYAMGGVAKVRKGEMAKQMKAVKKGK